MTDMKCLVCGKSINKRRSGRGWFHINVRMRHWAIPNYSRYNRENPNKRMTPPLHEIIYLVTAMLGLITAIIVLFREFRI